MTQVASACSWDGPSGRFWRGRGAGMGGRQRGGVNGGAGSGRLRTPCSRHARRGRVNGVASGRGTVAISRRPSGCVCQLALLTQWAGKRGVSPRHAPTFVPAHCRVLPNHTRHVAVSIVTASAALSAVAAMRSRKVPKRKGCVHARRTRRRPGGGGASWGGAAGQQTRRRLVIILAFR